MRRGWKFSHAGLLFCAGCAAAPLNPDGPATQQVADSPFTQPRTQIVQTSASYRPASQETANQVKFVRDKLIGQTAQTAQTSVQPNVIAIAAADPEIFHVGLSSIYITEGMVKQCQTEGQLAAVLANELGRMVSQREAAVSDQIRNPERLTPIQLPIGGNGNSREADPINYIEMARYERKYPKQQPKLSPPNPQLIARGILDRAGYQRTELDAAMPILQNAERFSALETQFKGAVKQSDWRQP